jgi:DNA/RNA-binding domain of Phe-tRNA-synthetase-like protein
VLHVDPHPLLAARWFETELPAALADLPSPDWLQDGLRAALPDGAAAPVARSEELRAAVRALLRHGGYRPTGRGKPSAEYLVRAAGEERLSSINLPVDACNVVSLHSGLPISVVDLDRVRPPLAIRIAPPDASYVFNASGQEIALGGLLCLFDADGPCANAVKDAQRTKTSPETRRTLSVLWAPQGFEEHAARAESWYRELLERAGAATR